MMIGDWKKAGALLDEAIHLFPEEPLIVSLLGVYWALMGNAEKSLECGSRLRQLQILRTAHHTYYQTACILALLGRRDVALEWLGRSVNADLHAGHFSRETIASRICEACLSLRLWWARCRPSILTTLSSYNAGPDYERDNRLHGIRLSTGNFRPRRTLRYSSRLVFSASGRNTSR